ncbi:hypothetical protein FSHL1_008486 [Fusarium sambucinum]
MPNCREGRGRHIEERELGSFYYSIFSLFLFTAQLIGTTPFDFPTKSKTQPPTIGEHQKGLEGESTKQSVFFGVGTARVTFESSSEQMADTPDNGQDSNSLRSVGGGSIDRAMAATRLTASSSSNISNYASSVSSDNQSQGHTHSQNLTGSGSGSGGLPGTPVSRRSGGWDRQTLSPAAAARVRHDDSTNEDYAPHQSSSLRPSSDLLEDSSDSSDEYVSTYKPLKTASRSRRFFQSMVNKLTKSSVRYGHLPNNQEEQDRNVIQHTVIINVQGVEYGH